MVLRLLAVKPSIGFREQNTSKKRANLSGQKNGPAQFSLGHHAIDRGAKIALSDTRPQVQKAAPPACGAVKC